MYGGIKDKKRDAVRPVGAVSRIPVIAEIDLPGLFFGQVLNSGIGFAVAIDVGFAIGKTITLVGNAVFGFAAFVGGVINITTFAGVNESERVRKCGGK